VELLLPRLGEGGELVEAAALRLHSFYTAVERCLLLISRVVNGGTPSKGEGWHRRLLERMATATEQRPAVFKEVTQAGLQEYLRFRHLVRNLYADELRLVPTTCEVQLKFSQQAPSPMRQSKEHGPWFQVHHANS